MDLNAGRGKPEWIYRLKDSTVENSWAHFSLWTDSLMALEMVSFKASGSGLGV